LTIEPLEEEETTHQWARRLLKHLSGEEVTPDTEMA
jgi:hypothetical protein